MSSGGWPSFLDRWVEAAQNDRALRAASHETVLRFAIRCGSDSACIHVGEGTVNIDPREPSFNEDCEFTLVGNRETWERFWQPQPPPMHHNVFALLARVESFSLEGSRESFAQNAHVVARLLELSRPYDARPGTGADREPEIEAISGRYVHVSLRDGASRIFVEESGQGGDLLLLHTAGADSRQYHHIMADPRLREDWHMVAFDMPAHGRSTPPAGMVEGEWRLDTDRYVEIVRAARVAFGLERPVVIGCSMGGQICLELAYRHPDEFSAVVACEASDRVEGRKVIWAKHPRVNESLFVPEWIDGLMGPQALPERRAEVRWTYSQGAHGIFYGDIEFYSGDWDARDRVVDIDTDRCPVYMLTGEYDFSCTPEMSETTARKIPGADFRLLPGLGHFPMAESPLAFMEHLRPVLREIREACFTS